MSRPTQECDVSSMESAATESHSAMTSAAQEAWSDWPILRGAKAVATAGEQGLPGMEISKGGVGSAIAKVGQGVVPNCNEVFFQAGKMFSGCIPLISVLDRNSMGKYDGTITRQDLKDFLTDCESSLKRGGAPEPYTAANAKYVKELLAGKYPYLMEPKDQAMDVRDLVAKVGLKSPEIKTYDTYTKLRDDYNAKMREKAVPVDPRGPVAPPPSPDRPQPPPPGTKPKGGDGSKTKPPQMLIV